MAEMAAEGLAEMTALEATALENVSQWMDANPTVRIDNSGDDEQLAVSVAISRNPASVPVYRKMVERQPGLLAIRFPDLEETLEEGMIREVNEIKRQHDTAGLAVLQEKLNPGRKEGARLDRLLGKPGDDRKGNPFPRGFSDMVREAATGKPLEKQLGSKTVGMPGRGRKTKGRGRKTRRRKTKSRTRKTK
jgi:hypothetical protein